MKKFLILSVVALAAVSVAVTAAFAKPAQRSATAHVCVLLPDTKSSVRWEQFDRPFMEKTLKAAKVSHTIINALGDAQKQTAQAEQCLANGAKVIIIASIDAGSAVAIEKKAAAAGAKSIDYDRQVEGGNAVDLHLVRRQDGRQAPGPGRHHRPEGEGHVQQEARRRRTQGRPDRQQRLPVQERQ